jgi:lysozyme family protein
MPYNYDELRSEYTSLLASMVITRQVECKRTADRLIKLMPRYIEVEAATKVPRLWLAAINERESSSNFKTYFGNGDPISRKTVHVPAGRGPFSSWEDGAKDALHLDRMDQVADLPGGWDWTRALFEGEAWNGFGPRAHGIHTGYLWAGTNHYLRGKYIKDGVWSADTVDTQLGIVPIMKSLVALDASIDLTHGEAAIAAPAPLVLKNVRALQASLNKLLPGKDLVVDGSYGRMTRLAVKEFLPSR